MTSVQDDGGTPASPPPAAGEPGARGGDAHDAGVPTDPGASHDPDASRDPAMPHDLDVSRGPATPHDLDVSADPALPHDLDVSADPAAPHDLDVSHDADAPVEVGASTDLAIPDGADPADGDDGLPARPYTPPPSPAYAAQPAPVIRYTRPDPDPAAGEPTGRPADPRSRLADRSVKRGRQLLVVGSLLVAAAGGTAAAVVLTGGDDAHYAFGQIASARGQPVVVVGESTGDARPLEVGETVESGWVVQLPGDAAITVELDGGGIARFDSGARVTVVDRAGGRQTGRRPDRAIEVSGGRAWINPGGPGSGAVEVRLLAGAIGSDGNPLAVDCTTVCAVEAPAGGVTVTTGTGSAAVAATPVADEVVSLAGAGDVGVQFVDGPSDWAQQNLAADADAGLPEPVPDDRPGIRDTAVLDGDLAVSIEVVGAPSGDPIPEALRYQVGESYALELAADGSACTASTCRVPITAADGATGSAQVADGSVALTLSQPIDCYDETYTSVVAPGIGTTTVAGTLEVTGVAHDGHRWLVDAVDGSGTVAATLSTACNADDSLGTSTSQVTITGR